MKMTNKEYKQARELAEDAYELGTFETYTMWGHANHYMKPNDIKKMRQEYKEAKKEKEAFTLDGFGNRALVIPTDNGFVLQSYYTEVAKIVDGKFYRLWDGFSTTTLKHVNIFRRHYGFDTLSKREWIELEVA